MVETVGVLHPVDAFALKVTVDGRTIVYSGDTGACPELTELAADADLLLCEASFRDGADNPPDLHMTGSDCGTHRHRGGRRADWCSRTSRRGTTRRWRWPRLGPRGPASSTSPWPAMVIEL